MSDFFTVQQFYYVFDNEINLLTIAFCYKYKKAILEKLSRNYQVICKYT